MIRMFIYKWMKIRSKSPFISFLKKHQVYVPHCICDLAPYKFENIHRAKPQIERTVRLAMLIRSKRSAYRNGNIRTQSHFLVRSTFSLYEKSRSLALRTNEIPLYFKVIFTAITNVLMGKCISISDYMFCAV